MYRKDTHKVTAPLTKEQLLLKLERCFEDPDPEVTHAEADNALLDYINDPEITEAWNKVEKWYA